MIADEQQEADLISRSASRWLKERYDFQTRRRLVEEHLGQPSKLWNEFAELGWLGMPFPTDVGGHGASFLALCALMEEFGRALVVEPYTATVLLGGNALIESGDFGASELVSQLSEGKLQLALAYRETNGGPDPSRINTRAETDAEGFVLNGRKTLVLNGDQADIVLVTALTRSATGEKIRLFKVPADNPGMTVRGYRTLDGMRAAEVEFSACKIPRDALCGELDRGWIALERVLDKANVATLFEAVGAMSAAFEMTVDYLRTRRQFGRPIAEFQVLRHRAVDMFIAIEEARSMASYAASALLSPDGTSRGQAISAAIVKVIRCGRFVGQQAIQLHGAIGLTDECSIGHYYKRLEGISVLLGGADHHLSRFAAGMTKE